jgi:ribosomal protein S18 acetylase RimI-like enzyme
VAFAVRVAVAPDAPSLVDLERDARAALVEVRGGPQLLAECPPVGDWAALIERSDRLVLVATIDDVVLGYLVAAMPASGPGGTGVVQQVHVTPQARELGFGDEMLDRAIAAVRDAGGTAIESVALPGDRDTKNLFERAGVTARKIVVHKRLGRTEAAGQAGSAGGSADSTAAG